jgi:hypothetical protein
MRLRPEPFADALTAWLRGEDTDESEGVAQLVSELAIRGLLYLRALDKAAQEQSRR